MRCTHCGAENPSRSKFCNECGASLGASRLSSAPAERRQLTVLFCDLVGSTVLSGQLDPEDLRELVRSYQEVCAKVIRHFDGHVAQFLGDGLLIYFGYPTAHEDDARRAVSAGLAILEAMRNPVGGRRLQVRIGIHTGLVVVGEMGGEGHREQLALGETPNIAARVQGEASPDWMVISEATQRLTRGFFNVETLGAKTLKGVAQPVPLYRIVSESGAVNRLDLLSPTALTPFVGREAELQTITRSMAEAEQGHGGLVMLCGEPGIGKSRILEVVKHREEAQRFEIIECQCSPLHSNSALYPVIEMLTRQMELKDAESAPEKLERLEKGLDRTGLLSPEVIPLFASLLGLPYEHRYPRLEMAPADLRMQTLEALQSWYLKAARLRPLMVILEDLHWADATTLELVRRLVAQEAPARILGLVTFRPEFRLPWGVAEHMAELTLQPLAADEAERLVLHVASRKRLPEQVQSQIVDRASGIPLFVEELTKTVLETGLLEEKEDRYELRGPLPTGLLPATVQDSLMARLDKLDSARPVAQLAATLGREFPYEVLQAVSNLDEASLQRELAWLVDAGLLFKQGTSPRAKYAFKHALIRDTAYESLLRKTRLQYHRQIVEALHTRFPEIAEAEPDVMAAHYEGAGMSWEAIREWQRAGERALASAALHEGTAHLERALELLRTLPESVERDRQEFSILIGLGAAYNSLRGWAEPSVDVVYGRALELAQRVGRSDRMAVIICGRWAYFSVGGDHPRTMEALTALRGLAENTQDGVSRSLSACTSVTIHYLCGEFTQAANLALKAEEHLSQEETDLLCVQQFGTSPFVSTFGYGLLADWHQGRVERAGALLAKILERRRQLDVGMTNCLGYWHACLLETLRRRPEQVRSYAEAMQRVAEKGKFVFWLVTPPTYIGWANIHLGYDVERSVELMLANFAGYRRFVPNGSVLGHFFALVVDGLSTAGQIDQALSMVEEGLSHSQQSRWCFEEPQLLRQKGELLLRKGGQAREELAEDCLRRSAQRSRDMGTRMMELRATLSLCSLWTAWGRHQEALELLEPAFRSIPENGDEAEFREARTLFQELRTAALGRMVIHAR